MIAKPDCYPCALNAVLLTAKKLTDNPAQQQQLIQKAKHRLDQLGMERTPADIVSDLFHFSCREAGVDDPFRQEMDQYNAEALALYPKLQKTIDASDDPIHTAILIAVAGNLIDLGIFAGVDVEAAIRNILQEGLAISDYDDFRSKLSGARSLLYILDNAGEAVFDKLLAETIQRSYPQIAVTFVVKEGPAMNDALRRDALVIGLEKVGRTISTGSSDLGVPVHASKAFWQAFHDADLVLAKGHANYETLDTDITHPALFALLRAKCQLVAGQLGVELHHSVLRQLISTSDG